MFVLLLSNLTRYESDGHRKMDLDSFQNNQNALFASPDDKLNRVYNDSRAAFNKFASEYDKALKEYLTAKQAAKSQHEATAAEEQRRADLQAKQAAQEAQRQKEMVDAQAASLNAEEDIRQTAVNNALEQQKQARAQKLKEGLESPAYKLWRSALEVQQGTRMIAEGQRALDHDQAVQQESGVTDLSARKQAGERILAGKNLVTSAFAEYKQLGGAAAAPSEVVPGPDPVADYR